MYTEAAEDGYRRLYLSCYVQVVEYSEAAAWGNRRCDSRTAAGIAQKPKNFTESFSIGIFSRVARERRSIPAELEGSTATSLHRGMSRTIA